MAPRLKTDPPLSSGCDPMSWQNNVASMLIVIGAIVIAAGGAAAFAIITQIVRQGGWRLAEPSIIQGRWQMVRPWLLVGAVIGLLLGIAIVFLNRDQTPALCIN
ncbi:MAG TPA: hypothetical protein VM260_17205 [Pirellula sp.]|nr:hypothetical protein [Pirellula sp.]